MVSYSHVRWVATVWLVSALYSSEALVEDVARPAIDKDGTVNVPAFSLPLSSYMSEQAKERFIYDTQNAPDFSALNEDDPSYIQKARRIWDDSFRARIERAKRRHSVSIEEQIIAGVKAHMVTPRQGLLPDNRNRILINLHGGGFTSGAGLWALAESIPVASIGRFRVLTVDYRLAPEHRFPAGSQDVAAVYKELLKQHSARQIGIYGCSAGGTLSAMAVSWFQRHGLPAPGALGLLSSAAFGNFYSATTVGGWSGDSAYFSLPFTGQKPRSLNEDSRLPSRAYLRDADLSDPLVSPALWPKVLAGFPPTVIITGTRANDLSAAIQTHRELTKAGADANLHLWDGMGHCFMVYDEDLPESIEAYNVLVRFFDQHLSI